MHSPELKEAGIEAVAKELCLAAEYHSQNWRLYIPKARMLLAKYFEAVSE